MAEAPEPVDPPAGTGREATSGREAPVPGRAARRPVAAVQVAARAPVATLARERGAEARRAAAAGPGGHARRARPPATLRPVRQTSPRRICARRRALRVATGP